MAEIWNAFLEDYGDEVFDWSLRFTLEVFWEYCQDGSKAVAELMNRRLSYGVEQQDKSKMVEPRYPDPGYIRSPDDPSDFPGSEIKSQEE